MKITIYNIDLYGLGRTPVEFSDEFQDNLTHQEIEECVEAMVEECELNCGMGISSFAWTTNKS